MSVIRILKMLGDKEREVKFQMSDVHENGLFFLGQYQLIQELSLKIENMTLKDNIEELFKKEKEND